MQWFNDPHAKEWTEQDKREWKERQAREKRERALRQVRAAQEAKAMIKASIQGPHPYLEYKGLGDCTGLVLGEKLIIPMMDCQDYSVIGAQTIALEDNGWRKKMLTGQRAKGAIYRIGNGQQPEVILCEGHATGLSVAKALRAMNMHATVCVTFSSGNLVYVAGLLGGTRMVFADNDGSGTGQRAAEETGLPWVMADQEGFDANDLYKIHGIHAVTKKIIELRKKACIYKKKV